MSTWRSLMSRVGAFARRRRDRGAAAVEFALVLPVLVTVIVGIIQYGNILATRHMMLYAARDAARSYAVGESDATAAQTLALSRLSPSTLTYTVTVTTAATASGSEVTVQISVPMAEAALVNILGDLMSGNIEASVTMRVET